MGDDGNHRGQPEAWERGPALEPEFFGWDQRTIDRRIGCLIDGLETAAHADREHVVLNLVTRLLRERHVRFEAPVISERQRREKERWEAERAAERARWPDPADLFIATMLRQRGVPDAELEAAVAEHKAQAKETNAADDEGFGNWR